MQNRTDFQEFIRLLQTIENSDTPVRVRTLGDPWMEFAKLMLLSDSAMILEMIDGRRVILNIKNVVEFQLERRILDYEAKTTYEIAY